jgi:hypothetical protein
MEDGQYPYNHEEESRGLYISAGNEDTYSNGNRERIEPLQLNETMRILRMEVKF